MVLGLDRWPPVCPGQGQGYSGNAFRIPFVPLRGVVRHCILTRMSRVRLPAIHTTTAHHASNIGLASMAA